MTYSSASPELRLNAAVGKTFRRRNLRGIVGVKREARVSAEIAMDAIIYLVGLVVVVMAILSFFGLH
jgi:hypothetical protein